MKLKCNGAAYVRPSPVFVFELRRGFSAGELLEVEPEMGAKILESYPGSFSVVEEVKKERTKKKVLGDYEVKNAVES